MHEGMQYDLIQGQGHEPFKIGNPSIFKSYLVRHLQWELATDHVCLDYGTISKFDRAGFLIFSHFFVSRDFEVGTNVSCEESTVSPHIGLIFMSSPPDRVLANALFSGCLSAAFVHLSRQILLVRYLMNA